MHFTLTCMQDDAQEHLVKLCRPPGCGRSPASKGGSGKSRGAADGACNPHAWDSRGPMHFSFQDLHGNVFEPRLTATKRRDYANEQVRAQPWYPARYPQMEKILNF